ncbi:hypothetical protein VIBNIMADA3021_130006 [Vibrio nigripulchritudo MADA3021]|nr:hypothetical protein VIBNIMADA3021_130006 [Vibrio nigripulchritudo MADA3021]
MASNESGKAFWQQSELPLVLQARPIPLSKRGWGAVRLHSLRQLR